MSRWLSCVCGGLMLLAGESSAMEVQATVKRIDADQRILVFTTRQQEHTVHVPVDAKVLDAAGRDLADGLQAKELHPGVSIEISVERNGDRSALRAIRLAGNEDDEEEHLSDGSTGRVTEFRGVGGLAIPAYIRKPHGSGPFPVVVLMHGGRYGKAATLGMGRSLQSPVADFIKAGWAVYAADYRPTANIAIVPQEVDDTIEAVKAARSMAGIDPQRVGLMGGSHGGQVLSRVVSRIEARGAILCAPAALDLIEVKRAVVERKEKLVPILMKLVGDMERKYAAPAEEIAKDPAKFGYGSALTEVAQVRCPILIINGRNDDNSPVSIIDIYVNKLRAAGKRVETYLPDNGPHGFYFGHPDVPQTKAAARLAVEFFQQQFGAQAGRSDTGRASGVSQSLATAARALPPHPSPAARPAATLGQPTQYRYGSMDWVDPDRTEPEGMKFKTFRSPTIKGNVSYLVYLPPEYERQHNARYPVLYYLPASGGMPRRDGADIARRVDKAIRGGRVSPMIVVVANGLRGNTMYCDSRDGQYPVETVIVKDLVPHVDATYRTVASREGRAVEGFSMGGFGAAHLGFKFPEVFGVVAIMAPPLLGPELKSPLPARAWSNLFPSAMGGDLEYFRANDPFTLVVKNANALRDRTLIWIVAHAEDENWLAPRCEELHRLLMQHTIPHAFFYLSNVKSHNRSQCLDTMGDAAFSFFSSTLLERRSNLLRGGR